MKAPLLNGAQSKVRSSVTLKSASHKAPNFLTARNFTEDLPCRLWKRQLGRYSPCKTVWENFICWVCFVNGFGIYHFLYHFFFHKLCRFSKDLHQMTGKQVKSRWKICWKFISPLIIFCVIIGGIVQMIEAMAKGKFTYTAWDRNQVSFQRRVCQTHHLQNLLWSHQRQGWKRSGFNWIPGVRKTKWLGRFHQRLKLFWLIPGSSTRLLTK